MEALKVGDEIMVRAKISKIVEDEQGKFYSIKIITTKESFGFNCADINPRDIVE